MPESMGDERIVVILLTIEGEPLYGRQEFIEQVLDSPVNKQTNKNFRYFTDLASKYHVMISDFVTSYKELDLATKVMMQFPVLFGITPNLEKIGHNSFDHYGYRGYLLAQWEPKPIITSSILKCVKCGSQYDLNLDSGLITRESHERDIINSGGSIISLQSDSEWPPPQDSVLLVKEASQFKNELRDVIDYLRKGKPRRWRCQECSFLQGYPGSFIRYAFSR